MDKWENQRSIQCLLNHVELYVLIQILSLGTCQWLQEFTCMSPEIQIPLSLSKRSPNLGLWEYTCICSFLLGIRIKLYYIFFWVPNFRVISFLSKPWSWSGKCSVFVRSRYFLSSLNKSNALWPLNFLTNFFIHYKKSKRNNRKPT